MLGHMMSAEDRATPGPFGSSGPIRVGNTAGAEAVPRGAGSLGSLAGVFATSGRQRIQDLDRGTGDAVGRGATEWCQCCLTGTAGLLGTHGVVGNVNNLLYTVSNGQRNIEHLRPAFKQRCSQASAGRRLSYSGSHAYQEVVRDAGHPLRSRTRNDLPPVCTGCELACVCIRFVEHDNVVQPSLQKTCQRELHPSQRRKSSNKTQWNHFRRLQCQCSGLPSLKHPPPTTLPPRLTCDHVGG